MNRRVSVLAAASLLAISGVVRAADKPGSVYLQCDGRPEAISVAKTAGMILAITATAGIVGGLVGAPETADVSKRLEGDPGVEACNAAAALNKDETREVQLRLAKAVHEIEAKHYDAAIADATSLQSIAPGRWGEPGFQRSLQLGALEIQASALMRSDRPGEAEAVALKMAAASPYDVANNLRASGYIGLTPQMTPAKLAYYQRSSRLYPALLARWAVSDEWSGDFAGAAARLADQADAASAFYGPGDYKPSASYQAHEAVALLFAGDKAAAADMAAKAKLTLDGALGDGPARQAEAAAAQELLDFYEVGRLLDGGHLTEARTAFAGRSRWISPSAALVAEMTARLRNGAPPATAGPLAMDPTTLRADGLAALARADANVKPDTLFAAIRYQGPSAFNGLSGTVWRVEKSRIVLERKANAKYVGDLLLLSTPQDSAAVGEALLLHAALQAKAHSASGFVIAASRPNIHSLLVRYGEAGKPAFPASATASADQVIADLSPLIPDPAKPKP